MCVGYGISSSSTRRLWSARSGTSLAPFLPRVLLGHEMPQLLEKEFKVMRGALKTLVMAAALAVALAPGVAHAQSYGYVVPWAAANGGNQFLQPGHSRTAVGVAAGGMGDGIIGGEVDFGYSPSFFGTNTDFGNNTVMDVMGNLVLGA